MEVHHKQVEKGVATHLLDQVQRALLVGLVARVGLVALADVLGALLVGLPLLHDLHDLLALRSGLVDQALIALLRHEAGGEVVPAFEEDLHGHVLLPQLVPRLPGVAEGPRPQVLPRPRGEGLDLGERPDLLPALQVPPARVEAPQELLQLVAAVEDAADAELRLRGVAGAGRERRAAAGLQGRGVAAVPPGRAGLGPSAAHLGELLQGLVAADRAARGQERQGRRGEQARGAQHGSQRRGSQATGGKGDGNCSLEP
mmetsp:Transcript_53665/g.143812  ORF Transcript_53665/g.143812 Transcript_53665/m.143812 type:complete len:257 (-) Transcript_53665:2-772(-)